MQPLSHRLLKHSHAEQFVKQVFPWPNPKKREFPSNQEREGGNSKEKAGITHILVNFVPSAVFIQINSGRHESAD